MIINNEKDFKIIADRVDTLFHKDKDLPDQVFKESFGQFVFDRFSASESYYFWDYVLQPLAKASGDDEINIIIIDDDAYEYFITKYNFYCAYKLNINASGAEYSIKLHTGPVQHPSDYPYASATKIVWISPSGKWTIYGDSEYEVLILGFSDGFHYTIPMTSYTNWISASQAIEDILRLPYRNQIVPKPWANEFLKNYSK